MVRAMENVLQHRTRRSLLLATLMIACLDASAADRRFVPVPNSDLQKLQVINGATIISAAGKVFHAGATIAPTSSRQAWLSVSIKNNGSAAVPFDDSNIKVAAGDKLMSLQPAESVLAASRDKSATPDKCVNLSGSARTNCDIDNFNEKQARRVDKSQPVPVLERPMLAPGIVLARQFQIELPKRSKSAPATLKVSVTVEGETIAFDFNELN